MIDVVCDQNPLAVGEHRKVQVSGNGPFSVKIGHFVTDPAPLGLHEQSNHTVQSDEAFELKADTEFWTQRKGGIQVDITDAKGARRRLHFNIQPTPRPLSNNLTRA
jgi:hypothetical protein